VARTPATGKGREPEVVTEKLANETDRRIAAAVSGELQKPSAVFNTHSAVLAGEFAAKAENYKALIAELDDQISRLEAERDDLMLSYTMLARALGARETE
jgi:hypothetical protein